MYITAIKSELKDKSKIWKFFPGIGEYSNSWVIDSAPQEQELLYDSVNFVLKNSDSDRIVGAELLMADQDGEIWSIRKDQVGRHFLRAGSSVSQSEFITGFFGEESGDEDISVINHHIWQKGTASYCKSTGFSKNSERVRKDLRQSVKHMVESQLHLYSQDEREAVDAEMMVEKVDALRTLRTRYLHLVDLIRAVQASSSEKSSDGVSASELKAQLGLIDEIAETLRKFYDNGVDLNRLKESKDKLEQEVTQLLAKSGLNELPSFDEAPDWEKVVSVLVRKRALERLAQSTIAAERVFNQHTVPVFNDHVKTVKDLIGGDVLEIEELAASLDMVRVEYDKILADISSPKEESNWSQYKSRLKEVAHKSFGRENQNAPQKTQEEMLKEKAGQNLERLTSVRFSIEQVLYKAREISNSLQTSPQDYQESLNAIRSLYERCASDLEGIQKEWKQVCETYSLPDNLNLRQLDMIMRNYVSVMGHRQRIVEINDAIEFQKTKLYDLVKLLKRWGEINQSQKIQNFDNPSVVITEAKRVLQYKREKEKRLQRLAEKDSGMMFAAKHTQHMRLKLEQVRDEWNQLFMTTGLHPMTPESDEAQQVIVHLEQLHSMDQINRVFENRGKANLLDHMLPSSAHLNIWRILETEGGTIPPGALINLVERNRLNSSNIYLLNSKNEAEAIRGQGVGVIVGSTRDKTIEKAPAAQPKVQVTRNQVGSKSAYPSTAQASQNTLLNERAKHVLDILNNKRT